uniref:Uncharacterized protein n=1 Tax=Arundo donax TaxID=35708 RepID=A0A0A9CYP0_ARUDO
MPCFLYESSSFQAKRESQVLVRTKEENSYLLVLIIHVLRCHIPLLEFSEL